MISVYHEEGEFLYRSDYGCDRKVRKAILKMNTHDHNKIS